MSISHNFHKFVEPPRGSKTASHTSKVINKPFAEITTKAAGSKYTINRSLSPFELNDLFDQETSMMMSQYEYFRITNLILTFHYIGNWLKPKTAIAVAFGSDPEVVSEYIHRGMRQETVQLFETGRNHVWKVPVPNDWKYCLPSTDIRLASQGQIWAWAKPIAEPSGDILLDDVASWVVTVESTIEFARETVLTNTVEMYQPLGAFGGVFGVNGDATIVYPGGDSRQAYIEIGCDYDQDNTDWPDEAFVQHTFPVNFDITVTDKVDGGDGAKFYRFAETITSCVATKAETTTPVRLRVPTNVASIVDWTTIFPWEIFATEPADYPFFNYAAATYNLGVKTNMNPKAFSKPTLRPFHPSAEADTINRTFAIVENV
jgi:hypothetical protein